MATDLDEYFTTPLENLVLAAIAGTETSEALNTFSNLLIKYMIVLFPDKAQAINAVDGLSDELKIAIDYNFCKRKEIIDRLTKAIN